MPILNVQNHETLLKQMRDELDESKRKVERLTSEKNELKLINNQLEHKVYLNSNLCKKIASFYA